ncbi:MAG: hypothetical protein A3B74_01760 [Candidatus Kerfeldbacteria bacterium RIFCSPHIGHO2_02_FULL_42_14]|uniref:DUF5667 domain-containing protein n=1 Tax=Candidatus Kerfeldbacteria bacterium RIFCSPHIGHO2_02_FULL_42_14 TaxID=1798540 RepID=A0A1G2AUR2_9BACT|nr:MAG: hypothetical protein A3B74_01760 [Candidatus Kerfeldbacteria bacterium RIFCSPHIGHO2_02_FULL_42_14]OGY82239.1 MAG: hypothetical protein A3E60_00090 [Candidatus Kerfeldbacteria bacterium RIFCSPHIGHO2_12_FULL_42_13]OGY82714.1 MAG: hypothetical protein A3I91_00980 [Candidatus Kerfeldbacteria bacterium RIFCSPLOWO2_02_FULL_42_19]OGY86076.1 MAG: hypothetical protein A3G01_03175 [Candidatus Kerfeldbacteria bacterium RIFCSPLOWO2_12_FULL_43_9]
MKFFSTLLSFLLLFTIVSPAFAQLKIPSPEEVSDAVNSAKNTASDVAEDVSEAVPDEYEEKIKEGVNTAIEETFDVRKQVVLASIDVAQTTVAEVNSDIRNSTYLNNEQKNQLLTCTAMTEQRLATYETNVSNAKAQAELTAAHQALVAGIQDDREEIIACANKAVMYGVKALLDTGKAFLETSEELARAVALCGVDMTRANELIAQGWDQWNQLNDLYNKIFADEKVTQDEQALVEQAIKLSADFTITLGLIYDELEQLSTKCE